MLMLPNTLEGVIMSCGHHGVDKSIGHKNANRQDFILYSS